jgi:hypothetical protein
MTSVSDLLKKKRQQTADKRLGSRNAYKFKGGVTTIRILPTWRKDGDTKFFHEFGQAFIKNMNGDTLAVIGDRKLTYGEDDPIRNLIERAVGDSTTDSQREHWKNMKASPRILVNALILDDREVAPTEAQIVEFSETQFDSIIEQLELAGIADEFLDLEKGFNLKVNKTGTGFKNIRYTFSFDRKPSAVPAGAMDTLTDIDAYVRSKFADTDRAINAIKSLTQGTVIQPKALSYSGNDDVVEGTFTEASSPAAWEGEDEIQHRNDVTDTEIDALFED